MKKTTESKLVKVSQILDDMIDDGYLTKKYEMPKKDLTAIPK